MRIAQTDLKVSRVALGTWAIGGWGGRRPDQLQPVKEVFGWSIDTDFNQQVEKNIDQTITDPVGPEFMAPPADEREATADTGELAEDGLEKVL